MLKKYIYISLGLIFVGLAFLGVFLPGIPTTPLILLSAWFFSKSSQRLEKWLKNHKTFGPLILNWEKYRGINRKSKIVNDLDEAQKLKEKAEKKLTEYKAIIEKAKRDAVKIIEENRKILVE